METAVRGPRTIRAGATTPGIYDEPALLPVLDQGAVATVLSRLIDIAEGRDPGHANRVAFVAVSLAERMRLPGTAVEAAFFGGLLHDIGKVILPPDLAPAANRGISGGGGRDPYPAAVARFARGFGLGEDITRAILEHHRYGWFGENGPRSRAPAAVVGQLVAAAERIDSVAAGGRSSLLVRRRGPDMARSMSDGGLAPEVIQALAELTNLDAFWIGYYDTDLISRLMRAGHGRTLAGESLVETFEMVGDLIDQRNGHPEGRSRRVGDLAATLAGVRRETPERRQLISVAALLQDVGTLGVPASSVRKTDLLTVDELTDVETHPVIARDVLSELPAMGAVAWWIGCHHERLDGRGYPAGFGGDEVPIESQLIGACEMFEALTSDRPHRPALGRKDALEVLNGLAGIRFDPAIVRDLATVVGRTR